MDKELRARLAREGYVAAVIIGGERRFMVTAKGLEKLGYPELAAEQRDAARQRLGIDPKAAG